MPLSSIISQFKVFSHSGIVTDNVIFKLHYLFSLRLFVCLGLLASSGQLFFGTFSCDSHNPSMPTKAIEHHCIGNVFSVERGFLLKNEKSTIYPGIIKTSPHDDIFEHNFYQWLSLLLIFFSALFYVPRYYWKKSEKNLINSYVTAINGLTPDTPEEVVNNTMDNIARTFMSPLQKNTQLLVKYWLAEFLNICIVVFQFWFSDVVFKGRFRYYGLEVINYFCYELAHQLSFINSFLDLEPMEFDPTVHLFPAQAKCTIKKFGSSGDIEKSDIVCYLSLNYLYRWAFLFIWFLYCLLFLFSVLTFVFRLRTFFCPCTFFLFSKGNVSRALSGRSVGDFFILNFVYMNITNPERFGEFVRHIQIHNPNCSPLRRRKSRHVPSQQPGPSQENQNNNNNDGEMGTSETAQKKTCCCSPFFCLFHFLGDSFREFFRSFNFIQFVRSFFTESTSTGGANKNIEQTENDDTQGEELQMVIVQPEPAPVNDLLELSNEGQLENLNDNINEKAELDYKVIGTSFCFPFYCFSYSNYFRKSDCPTTESRTFTLPVGTWSKDWKACFCCVKVGKAFNLSDEPLTMAYNSLTVKSSKFKFQVWPTPLNEQFV